MSTIHSGHYPSLSRRGRAVRPNAYLEASGWAIKTLANFAKEHPGEAAAYVALIVLATALVYVAAGAEVGTVALAEGMEAGGASAQMLPRTIFREYLRLELGAAESALERANLIANAASPPMSGGAAAATQVLEAVLPRTALSAGLRSHVVSKSAHKVLTAGTGLTLALGAHTASAQGQDHAQRKEEAAASLGAVVVNFTRLFALRPYTPEEWVAGKYPDPDELRLGERFQSRYSPEDTKGGHYRYIGIIQLT